MINCTTRPLGTSAGSDGAISIAPAQLDIPPLDNRFVLLSFAPTAVRGYAAMLDIAVTGIGTPSGFRCEASSTPICSQHLTYAMLLVY